VNETSLLENYSRRANEYDDIYEKPERQRDLVVLRDRVRKMLEGHRILEVACGTGYWTALLSEVCPSVVATDASPEVLRVARSKSSGSSPARFVVADAFHLDDVDGNFTAGFASFWWSHVPREQLHSFLAAFHRMLQPGAIVCFVDNQYVEGSSTPPYHTDERGNSYQRRRLKDGTEFRVVKNFPTQDDLLTSVAPWATGSEVEELQYYWTLSYRLDISS
jgi:demethylmenaquinone methyltransferase/2-methoxy-6-polyprenyl-1,4-benzoquinol methylase